MSNGNGATPVGNGSGARTGPRVHSLREILISYEGQDEQIVIKPPNLGRRGMFINTSRTFPEGAVLNLQIGLVLTNAVIRTRCEVRYCQPGVGIGVEFIGLTSEDERIIEREIESSNEIIQPKATHSYVKQTGQAPRAKHRRKHGRLARTKKV